MSAVTTLSWRYVFRRRLRAALTITAITFGVALVVAMGGMVPALSNSLTAGVLSSVEHVDLSLSAKSRQPFPAEVLEQVRTVDGVDHASARVFVFVSLPPTLAPKVNQQPLAAVQVNGVDFAEPNPVRAFTVMEGRVPNAPHELVVSETLKNAGVGVGATLRLPSTEGQETFQVVGVTGARPGGVEPVFTSLDDARSLGGLGAVVSEVDVRFAANASADTVRAAVLAKVGDGFVPEGSRNHGQLAEQVTRMAVPMQAFGVLAMVMAGFIIFITFRTVVAERRRDLGLLRALGASRSMVVRLVVIEGLTLGVMGTALGILLGLGIERLVVSGMAPVWRHQIGLELKPVPPQLGTLLWAVLLGVGGSVASCLLPARQASAVSPREAMRPSAGQIGAPLGRARLVVGAVFAVGALLALVSGQLGAQAFGIALFCVAVLLLGPLVVAPVAGLFGAALSMVMAQETRLAQGNVQRQRHRSSITAAVVAVALAIVVALAALAASTIDGLVGQMDRTMKADFMVMPPTLMPGAGLGAKPELAASLRGVSGVETVSTIRSGQAQADGTEVTLIGLDPATFSKVGAFDLVDGSIERLSEPRTMVANPAWANAKKVKVGDRVRLTGSTGAVEYEVIAIGADGLFYRLPTAYLSQRSLETDFGLTTDMLIFVNQTKGASTDEVGKALGAQLEQWPGFVLHQTKEWRDRLMADGRRKMNSLYVLLAVLVVPALVALANTLGINVLERIRELGLLRAIGSTRRQVRRLILAESLLLASVGGLIGVVGGLWLGFVWVRAMAAFGMNVPFQWPLAGLLVTVVMALVFGALAALAPARHAVSLKITSALRHE